MLPEKSIKETFNYVFSTKIYDKRKLIPVLNNSYGTCRLI